MKISQKYIMNWLKIYIFMFQDMKKVLNGPNICGKMKWKKIELIFIN